MIQVAIELFIFANVYITRNYTLNIYYIGNRYVNTERTYIASDWPRGGCGF